MDALVVILATAITLALALPVTASLARSTHTTAGQSNATGQNTAVVDVLIILGLSAICSGVSLVHTSISATAAIMVLWAMTVLTSLALNRHMDHYEHTARITARDTASFDRATTSDRPRERAADIINDSLSAR